MSSQDTASSKDKYKEYINVDTEAGNSEPFACIFCDNKFKSLGSVKGHITRKHRDQIKDSEPGAEDAEDDLDVSVDEARHELLEREMLNAEVITETTTNEEEVETRMVIDAETEQLGSLPEAVDKIKMLVEDRSIKEELIKKLKKELETSKDLANIANGEKEEANIKNEALKVDNIKYKRWLNNQTAINDKMKETGVDPEMKKSIKKLEEELKVKSKALEASEKVRKELLKKVEEEVAVRGNLEADKERLSKTIDALTKLADQKVPTEVDKSKIKCRDVGKPGGCPRAGSCRFKHPDVVESKDKKNIDCVHWMSGKCKFSDKVCHYKHDEDKKGIKTTKRKRSEDSGFNTETEKVDFLQGLVRTLAQGSAAEARLGSPRGSAWGMENQRNNRPRLASPEMSSQGMDGQRGSSSYNSRTFYNSREQEPWRQERRSRSRDSSRPDSPARRLDVEGLMDQLRGLEKSGQTAPRKDTVQEGVDLLLRIAQQQAGRR